MITLTIESDIAFLKIESQESRLNFLTNAAMRELDSHLDEIGGGHSALVGLIIYSGKPDNFVVGVDIKDFLAYDTAEQAAELSRTGQNIFRKIAALSIPSVAAINGPCLGGGLEMALNCTARVITDHPKSALGFPEVKLGLLPGASGSQLLPRLSGISAALEMMLTGKNIYPYRARKMNLVSDIVRPGALLTAAETMLRRLADGRRYPAVKKPLMTRLLDGLLRAVVYRAARKNVMKQTGANYPAPHEIIRLTRMTQGKSLERGLAAEANSFGFLSQTQEHKALMHFFFASRASADHDPAAVREVQQLAVLGGGLMGGGIATIALDRQLTVRQKDINLDALAGTRRQLQKYFGGKAKKRIIQRRDVGLILSRYSTTLDYSGFGRTDAVIEAVYEDLFLKRKILADLEQVLPAHAIIATNTSSIPIAEIASEAQHPERVIGMHFFSPVERMPLLEIIPSKWTDSSTIAGAIELGKKLGKTVIVVGDSPGFFVNRILTPYLSEAFHLLEDGIEVQQLDGFARRMGFPVGPLNLLDEVGLDVAGKVSGVMSEFLGERLEMTDHNARFLEDGRLGRKNGRGFYLYAPNGQKKVDATVYNLLDNPARKPLAFAEVRDRLLYAILNEAAFAWEEGLIRSTEAGDTGSVYGFGFPPFLGGPYWMMNAVGPQQILQNLQRLTEQHGARFRPAPILMKLADSGAAFPQRV